MPGETHTLLLDGSPFDENGLYIDKGLDADGTGYGMCSCGARSPREHDTAMQRLVWFQGHIIDRQNQMIQETVAAGQFAGPDPYHRDGMSFTLAQPGDSDV